MYTKNEEEREKQRKVKNIETAVKEGEDLIRNTRKTAGKCKEKVNKTWKSGIKMRREKRSKIQKLGI